MSTTAWKAILVALTAGMLLASCQPKKKITLATGIEGSVWHENGLILAEAMKKYGWEIEVKAGPGYGPENNLNLVKNKLVDLAWIYNSNIHSEEYINSVVSLNTEVLLVLCKENPATASSLHDLVRGKTILFPELNSEPRRIISRVFRMMEVDTTTYVSTYVDTKLLDLTDDDWVARLDQTDIIILFSELHNPQIRKLLRNGWNFFSGARVEDYQHGSLVDAFCYQYPWAFPFLVPRSIFGRRQNKMLNTIGIKSLLVAHEDTSPMLVYDFLDDFNKALPIISKKRVAFAESRHLDKSGLLSFPLHPGAVRYRDREKPKFAERYAELIALMVTLSVIGSGLIARYLRLLKQAKKDRIDVYYTRLIDAKSIEELNDIRQRAIRQLQLENLAANDSFIIFLMLYEELKEEIMHRG